MWTLAKNIYILLKNNKWAYVKNQTKARAVKERTSEIHAFKRVYDEEVRKSTSLVGLQLNYNLAQTPVCPPANCIFTSVSDLLHLNGVKSTWGHRVIEVKPGVDLSG